jgi:hypothetical protein
MKLKLDQSERRIQETEQLIQEHIQGQATVEQEAQRIVQARADLYDVRKEFDAAKKENLVLFHLIILTIKFISIQNV